MLAVINQNPPPATKRKVHSHKVLHSASYQNTHLCFFRKFTTVYQGSLQAIFRKQTKGTLRFYRSAHTDFL